MIAVGSPYGCAQLADRIAREQLRGNLALRRAPGLHGERPAAAAAAAARAATRPAQQAPARCACANAIPHRAIVDVASGSDARRRQHRAGDEAQVDAFDRARRPRIGAGARSSAPRHERFRLVRGLHSREQRRQRGDVERSRGDERRRQRKRFAAAERARVAQQLPPARATSRKDAGERDRRSRRASSADDEDDRHREKRRAQRRRLPAAHRARRRQAGAADGARPRATARSRTLPPANGRRARRSAVASRRASSRRAHRLRGASRRRSPLRASREAPPAIAAHRAAARRADRRGRTTDIGNRGDAATAARRFSHARRSPSQRTIKSRSLPVPGATRRCASRSSI